MSTAGAIESDSEPPPIKWVTTTLLVHYVLTEFLSDVESLKKGIIKVSKNQVGAPYTILIVGETGVGKSSVLEFIANVLSGREMSLYNFEILDHTNEQVGSNNQSKTNSARLYEFTSKSGIVVSASIYKHRRYE
jgi:predicted ATPase